MESVTWRGQQVQRDFMSQFQTKKHSDLQQQQVVVLVVRSRCFDTITRNLQRSRLRNRMKVVRIPIANMSTSNGKRANLSAARKDRIKLPKYDDDFRGGDTYHISKFLSHPSGIEAVLNKEALRSFELIDSNIYRCILPKLKLLNFEATPLLDLRVVPTSEDCTVEMLSCKFEGSKLVERQNENFSASMKNQMTWETSNSDTYLEIDVTLNLTLEIYTRPFTFLPTSAVEGPGNIMMQTLLDRLVPLLLQQLIEDYRKWADVQRDCHP